MEKKPKVLKERSNGDSFSSRGIQQILLVSANKEANGTQADLTLSQNNN
jgi:hypothetical protein